MEFLKLIQKKGNKTDNKIIAGTVILVFLIMSAVVFWPSGQKYHLLAYLPDDASFYYHWTSKKTLSENVFNQTIPNDKISDLENILGNNFLNLQEILWFRIDGRQEDNYLLRFSRLPKSLLLGIEANNSEFRSFSPQKNILLLNSGREISSVELNLEKDIYFKEGISIFWQKNKNPDFLDSLAQFLDTTFVDDRVLLNWQSSSKTKSRLSLLENRSSELKDIKYFLTPQKFDLAFGFNNNLSDTIAKNISNSLLKTFFDSLPYYNLNTQVIKDRLLTDAIIWQRDDGWILASERDWRESILDFVDSFELKEVPKVLSDGTAYIEYIATPEQNIIEHQINGQKVLQIDKLFIWDIGNKHYLSNQKALIANLSSNNYYLSDLLADCLPDPSARVGDFIYFETKDILDGQMKDYLLDNNINGLEILSYTTGTISGLNICF